MWIVDVPYAITRIQYLHCNQQCKYWIRKLLVVIVHYNLLLLHITISPYIYVSSSHVTTTFLTPWACAQPSHQSARSHRSTTKWRATKMYEISLAIFWYFLTRQKSDTVIKGVWRYFENPALRFRLKRLAASRLQPSIPFFVPFFSQYDSPGMNSGKRRLFPPRKRNLLA